jgi:hypothetical protein
MGALNTSVGAPNIILARFGIDHGPPSDLREPAHSNFTSDELLLRDLPSV